MTSTDWSSNFKFLQQGARIQEFRIAGHNIVLGFDKPEDYDNDFNPFFGETIGRVANRVSAAKINNLNGRSYQLAVNNGPNSLHGGKVGWGRRVFSGPDRVYRNGREALLFKYLSPDGDEGYPGTVLLQVWYYPFVDRTAGEVVSLEIEYEVELVGDEVEETAINVCNHSYFNISGQPTIAGTEATFSTAFHQVTNAVDIPTEAIDPFPGIKSNEVVILGTSEPDIDHCFVMNVEPETVVLDTRSQPLQRLCKLHHPDTGISLEVLSTEPAFQFYTGKYIDVPALGSQPARGPRSGICIEASRYVNAVNVDAWRDMVILKKGQKYGSQTIYRASIL